MYFIRKNKKSIEIMIDIVASEGPSETFKQLFYCEEKIDSIDISNCHIILQKILLDKEVIPKILVLKYILTFFDDRNHTKSEYKSIYSIFTAGVLFSVFAGKKESESFYRIVKSTIWIDSLNDWIFKYISSHELTKGKLRAAYKYSESDKIDVWQQASCKSLAALMNFVRVKKIDDKVILKLNNCKKFNIFLSNKQLFSVEHFILGENGTLKIDTGKYKFNYKYPSLLQRYRHSLFNYIFIPYELNNSLENRLLNLKLNKLQEKMNDIECLYSKEYCRILMKQEYFSEYPTNDKLNMYGTEEEARNYLNQYFAEKFLEEFLDFSTNLIKKFHLNF